jgi:hypothetical protein
MTSVDARLSEAVPVDRYVSLAVLAGLSVLSRLPQLLSPNLLLDGDECTLGLMAKHLAQGREFPIFFYGQHYGFSAVEAGAGAVTFLLFGVGQLPLKVAMLSLWTAGVLFLFLGLARLLGTARAFWITSVFVLTPAWAVWSMKARGGYITSFAATSVLFWLLAQDRARPSIMRWLLAGALTSLIYLAQPVWLPGALPILIAVFVSRRRLSDAVCYLIVPAATVVLVKTWGDSALGNADLLGSVPAVMHQIYMNFTGAYYLSWAVDPPGPATKILAWAWCAMLAGAVVLQIYRVVARRYHPLSHLLFLSVCATLAAEWMLLHTRDARYLLPISGPLVLLAGLEAVDLVERRLLPKMAAIALTFAMLGLGTLSMREFANFAYLWGNPPNRLAEAKRLRQVIDYVKARGIRHVFSMNGLLEWQLIFYSDEDVVARFQMAQDRYPPYVRAVDRALSNGEPVAVVGYTDTSGAPGCAAIPICTGGIERLIVDPGSLFTVDGKYFVYARANRDLLDKLGFRFPD